MNGKSNQHRRSSGAAGKGGNVAVEFHTVAQTSVVANTAQNFPVRPDNYSNQVLSVSDGYELFRVRRLRVRILLLVSGTAALGVVASVPNTPPAAFTPITELLDSLPHAGPAETRWSKWLEVRPQTLSGPFPWYHTRVGTFDPTEAAPATVCLIGSAAGILMAEWRGVFEFKNPCDPANTPEEKALLHKFRVTRDQEDLKKERDLLLKKLSPSACTAP
jgi:hypothetical protein